MRAVIDTSVIVAAIGWRGDARKVLRFLARRGFESCRTPALSAEWFAAVEEISKEPDWKNANWENWLAWLNAVSGLAEDIPPKKKISRDKNDDMVVMAAVSSGANCIVTLDNDLLVLKKPFGIACVTPRQFISLLLENPV